jgi:hypothetical protein
MTERPILFSAEMVRAILDGRKTQTRRVVKLTADGHVQAPSKHLRWYPTDPGAIQGCRYGQPGDTLWVREAWCQSADDGRQVPLRMATLYRADGDHVTLSDGDGFTQTNRDGSEKSPWRPSIHMPRWASRITLRITDIRVERLQDITEDDARAEGCDPVVHPDGAVDCGTRKTTFASLWNKINGPGAWDENPWVWVVAFERVKP